MPTTPLEHFQKNRLLDALKVFETDSEQYFHDEATLRSIFFIYSSTGQNERIPHILHLLPLKIKNLLKDVEVEYFLSQGRSKEAKKLLRELAIEKSVRTIALMCKAAPELLSLEHLNYLKKISLKSKEKEEKLLAKFLIAKTSSLLFSSGGSNLYDLANDYAFQNREFTRPTLNEVIDRLSSDHYTEFDIKAKAQIAYRVMVIVGPSTSGKTYLQNAVLNPTQKKNYDESLYLLKALNDNFQDYENGSHGVTFKLSSIHNLKLELTQNLKLSRDKWNIFTLPYNLPWLPVIERVFF